MTKWNGHYTVEVEGSNGVGQIVFIAPGAKIGLEYTDPKLIWELALNLPAMIEDAGGAMMRGEGKYIHPEDAA